MAALVGRARELRALTDALVRLQQGTGGTTAIVGASGMGKSRLLDEAAAMAPVNDVVVTRVQCTEAGAAIPLSTARALAAALGLGGVAEAEDIAERAEDRAARTPELVVVDDAQWVDSASLPHLLALVRTAAEVAIAFVFASRPPGEEAATTRRLLAAAERRGASVLVLHPLADAEVAELVGAITNSPIDHERHAVLAAAAGNPYLAVELAEAWRDGHSPSAESLLAHALSHVTSRTRAVLEAASVLGRDASVADIAHMHHCVAGDLSDSVREAISSGLVDGEGAHVQFRHDLVRDAVYESLPMAVRGALHRDAAEALAARGVPVAELAFHLVQGALPGDTAAIDWLRQAASEAASSDLREAVHLLEAARRLCVDGSRMALEVDQRLVVFYAWLGRSAAAIHLARQLLDDPLLDRHEVPRLRARLAEALARGGDERAGAFEATRALATEGLPDGHRATLLVLAATGKWETDPAGCRQMTALARELTSDDDAVTLASMQLDAVSFGSELKLESFLAAAAEGVRFAKQCEARRRPLAAAHATWALSNAAEAALVAEQVQEALQAVADAERAARRAGLTIAVVPMLLAVRAEVHLLWCRWDDALTEIEARENLLADAGLSDGAGSGVPMRSVALRARVAAHTDASTATGLLATWSEETEHPVEAARVAFTRTFHAFLEADDPGVRDASSAVVSLLRQLESHGRAAAHGAGWFTSWLPAHRALSLAGISNDARFLAEHMLPVCEMNEHVPRFAATKRAWQAFTESRPELVDSSLDAARAISAPLLRFHALCVIGSIATDIGAPKAAVRATDAIEELIDRHGLRVPRSLFGEPSRAVVARAVRIPRPTTGWESLTPTERRTAELVAQGLSNREIAEDLLVSRYTVETHVKHIFRKLGIDSRVKLATLVVGRQSAEASQLAPQPELTLPNPETH